MLVMMLLNKDYGSKEISHFAVGDTVMSIFIYEDYTCLGDGRILQVLDISNPLSPLIKIVLNLKQKISLRNLSPILKCFR